MNKEKLRQLNQQLDSRYDSHLHIKAVIEALLEEEDDWSRARSTYINVAVLETENGYKISTAPYSSERREYIYDAGACPHPEPNHLKFALRGALRKLADQLAEELEGVKDET